jgi:carbamoylphosphate synthase large subunit
MRQAAIIFVDIDDSAITLYTYREPHFAVARQMGMACLTVALASRQHKERLHQNSDDVFYIGDLSVAALLAVLPQISEKYYVEAMLCYAGQASKVGEVGCIVAQVCTQIGLRTSPVQAIANCNNKFLMRHVLQQHGVRSIRYGLCSDEQELHVQAKLVGYPLIAKPLFGAGSAFIKKCHNWDELRTHYASFVVNHGNAVAADFYGAAHDFVDQAQTRYHHQPGRTILLEEFIDGIEASVECAISKNTAYPILINEKLILTEKSGTVLENLLITPSVSFSAAEVANIKQYAVECVTALGLKNAIVHLEFRQSARGPVVIEINPRLGGLYVNSALRDLANLNPYQLYLDMLLDKEDIDQRLEAACQQAENNQQHFAMFAVYPDKSGHFRRFKDLAFVAHQTEIIEYATVYEADTYVDAEIEEHYLLKGWTKVKDASHAHALYDEVLMHLQPEITH